MPLTGIQIYKLLPKTNCKDCGMPTCLAFAMNLSSRKIELSKCPHLSDEAIKFFSNYLYKTNKDLLGEEIISLEELINKKINMKNLAKSEYWKKSKKRKDLFEIIFSSHAKIPLNSCLSDVKLIIKLYIKDERISNITNTICTINKFGEKRNFKGYLNPIDIKFAFNKILEILD